MINFINNFYKNNQIKVWISLISTLIITYIYYGLHDGIIVFGALFLFTYLLFRYIRFLFILIKQEKNQPRLFKEKSNQQKRLYVGARIPVITFAILLTINTGFSLNFSSSPLDLFFVDHDVAFNSKSEIEKCRELYNQKTPKSWELAYDSTCSKLARYGNGEAQYYIGMIIKNSPKIPNYKAQAFSFFYAANKNGEERARGEMEGMKLNKRELERTYNFIGNIYNSLTTDSTMIKKDDQTSFSFLKKSALLGNKTAQSGLASGFALGFFETYKFNEDLLQAYKWSYLSIQDNIGFFPDSVKDIETEKRTTKKVFDKIESMCDKSQILQGRKLAEEWIKNNLDLIKDNQLKN